MKRECYQLGGVQGQPEEAFGIGRRRPSELLRIDAADGGELRQRQRHPRRLVALAAMGHRCKIGGVGLDEEAGFGHQPQEIVVRPLFERHDPAERHVPAGVDRQLGKRVLAGVAMQYPGDARRARLAEDDARILFRVARMDDDRPPGFGCQRDLGGERGALGVPRRIVIVVVEAALPHSNRSPKHDLAQLRNVAGGIKAGGIVRVDPGGREHEAAVFSSAGRGDGRGIERLADADDRRRARGAGAGDYLLAVAGERRVREVGVAVDED